MADKEGNKTGGRVKGVPNKRTLTVIETAEEMGVNPIEFLCLVMKAEVDKLKDVPTLDQRIAAAKELASYMFPKRKAIEHTGKDGEKLFTYEDYLKNLETK